MKKCNNKQTILIINIINVIITAKAFSIGTHYHHNRLMALFPGPPG